MIDRKNIEQEYAQLYQNALENKITFEQFLETLNACNKIASNSYNIDNLYFCNSVLYNAYMQNVYIYVDSTYDSEDTDSIGNIVESTVTYESSLFPGRYFQTLVVESSYEQTRSSTPLYEVIKEPVTTYIFKKLNKL